MKNTHKGTKGAAASQRFSDFRSVVERHQSLVWAVAYSITGDASLSEDVAQETFLAAWNQQADIRDLDKLKGYLATIARNLGRKAMRGAGREVAERDGMEAGERIEARGPLEGVIEREELSQVAVALEQMPEPSREAFVLFYSEEQSVARVAEQLELSQSAVKQRLYRARESLKASLEQTLSSAVLASTPGKAFTVATIALVLAKGTAASAASLANASGAESLAQTESLSQTESLATSAFKVSTTMVGAAIAVASASVVLWLALGGTRADDESERGTAAKGVSARAAVAPIHAPAAQPWNAHRHTSAADALAETKINTNVEEGVVASRIAAAWPDADINGDGRLSDDEILVLRDAQEDELTEQILEHWQDPPCETGSEIHPPYGVTCAFVEELGDGENQEGFSPYNLFGLRTLYEEELKVGLDMDAREWVASKVATEQKNRICHEITASHHDLVHELRGNANGVALHWTASVALDGGQAFDVSVPKKLRKMLYTVSGEFEAEQLANEWGVRLWVIGPGDEPPANVVWEALPPAIQVAVEAARGGRTAQ
tara:strand:+ start:53727 stop:55370 length:1644 start_codon:yes stop_codon:yes gene_type:complete